MSVIRVLELVGVSKESGNEAVQGGLGALDGACCRLRDVFQVAS